MLPVGFESLPQFLETLGYVGLFCIVFLESGIPFGFFFPGDTLIFTAGLLASQGIFSIPLLLILIPLAAILGDSAGYWLGSLAGKKLWTQEKGFFFNKGHREHTETFYKKYGVRAIILARFVPVVRTFVPFFAGMGTMHYPTFIRYNIIGGLLWGVGVTSLGYGLGRVIPDIDQYLIPIVILITIVSFFPILKELWEERTKKVS